MHLQQRPTRFWIACLMTLFCVSAAFGQQITFPDFSSTAGLQLNGSSHTASWQEQNVLRLTDGGTGPNGQSATTFFTTKQPVAGGFTTYFKFQMHTPTTCCFSADGLAFLVQNAGKADQAYGAQGAGVTALGVGGGGIGYAGVPNSLAVEFDVFGNQWDPEGLNTNANHIAVQSCGTNSNTPVHYRGDTPNTIGNVADAPICLVNSNTDFAAINSDLPVQIAGSCIDGCQDGQVHEVVIEYTPPIGDASNGRLQVWIDPTFVAGTHTPNSDSIAAIDTPYTIAANPTAPASQGLALDPANGGSAWVGFGASQGFNATVQDILAWEFTPHVPTVIEQPIPAGGTTAIFNFGSHNLKVTYPPGFINPTGIIMEVTATTVDPTVFQATRLASTPFAAEQCVVYEGTGGNCVVYSVVCEDPNTDADVACPSEPTPTIDIKTNYDTLQNVGASPDFLKADPIGSNNWISIFTSFIPLRVDPTTAGKGKNFSDIVATFGASAIAPPAISCIVPPSTAYSASDVSVPCTATTNGELIDPTLSSFNLRTSVPPNTETSNASTNSVQVCDILGHCSTAGPYSGFKVDKKGPSITITTPPNNASYQINAAVVASFNCADGGSGLGSCLGTVPNGSNINTAAVGNNTFVVNAADVVGNTSMLSTNYIVGFGNACLLYNPNFPIKRGSLVPVAIYLCDAKGRNVSRSSIHVHAVQLTLTSTGAVYPIQRDGDNDIDDDFQFVPFVNWYAMIVKTKGLPAGRYNLTYTATGDPNPHTLSFLLTN